MENNERRLTRWEIMQREVSKAPMARLHLLQIALEYEDSKALLVRIKYDWDSYLAMIDDTKECATLDDLDRQEQNLKDYAKAYETVEDAIHRFEQARDLEDHTSKDNFVWIMLDGKIAARDYFGALVTIENAINYIVRVA